MPVRPHGAVVARVDGVPLFADALARQLRRRRPSEGGAPLPAASALALRRALLTEWIDRQVLLAAAERRHVTVGRDAAEAALTRLRAGWEPTALAQALAAQQLTAAELRRELHDNLTVARYLEAEVWPRQEPSDDDVARCAAAAPELLAVPEMVRARHLVVATAEQAAEVAAAIRRGTRFEDAAMAVSLAPAGRRGGDLGLFARGAMPPLVEQACFSMRPGAVSPVLADTYGYHLFKVLERRPAVRRTPAQARADIAAHLRGMWRRRAEAAAVAALRQAATIVVEEGHLAEVS